MLIHSSEENQFSIGNEHDSSLSNTTGDALPSHIDSADDNASLKVLKKVFGHDTFKPGQLESIDEIMSGKDVIAVVPTGGGKTIIYAIPCILKPGIAVVVSPLMMLMCDQVARLRSVGINTCYYNTLLKEEQRRNILHNIQQSDCQYQFVFVSPESVISESFQKCLDTLEQRKRLNMFIIDEAHCVENWGKHFRPSYQELGVLRKYNAQFVALTGTATKRTLSAISSSLQMQNEVVLRLPCRRNNLGFSVLTKKETKAKEQIAEIIKSDFGGQCGIVYCARQADTVEMAFQLKEKEVSSTFYHAGMDGGERIRNVNLWMEGKVNVICCTNAFGMGVDKKCVRFVIHLTLPSSIEDYIQESGRGGRDGDSCSCIMFFRFADRFFHIRNIAALPTSDGHELSLLNKITNFCIQQSMCRQQFICKYFEEDIGELCKSCDICQKDIIRQEQDMTEHAKAIIQCLIAIIRLKSQIRLSELAMTFMGSKAKVILEKNFHTVAQHGKGKNAFPNTATVTRFIYYLVSQGFINENINCLEDRSTVTYLTCGNIDDLLHDKYQVLYTF